MSLQIGKNRKQLRAEELLGLRKVDPQAKVSLEFDKEVMEGMQKYCKTVREMWEDPLSNLRSFDTQVSFVPVVLLEKCGLSVERLDGNMNLREIFGYTLYIDCL